MWVNLVWFGTEFRSGDVPLITGETASVRRFIQQGRGFSADDLTQMVAEQRKILRDHSAAPHPAGSCTGGSLHVALCPHPILPLLVDTDQATIDRPGTLPPSRFAYPEDADEQIVLAARCYARWHFDHVDSRTIRSRSGCAGVARFPPSERFPAAGKLSIGMYSMPVEQGLVVE